jgi:hypothetical protein
MVEVIDSSSGVAKMCAHTNQTGSRNLLLKIGKSDYPIWQIRLSGFVDSGKS